jgi:hypothetical protein
MADYNFYNPPFLKNQNLPKVITPHFVTKKPKKYPHFVTKKLKNIPHFVTNAVILFHDLSKYFERIKVLAQFQAS